MFLEKKRQYQIPFFDTTLPRGPKSIGRLAIILNLRCKFTCIFLIRNLQLDRLHDVVSFKLV